MRTPQDRRTGPLQGPKRTSIVNGGQTVAAHRENAGAAGSQAGVQGQEVDRMSKGEVRTNSSPGEGFSSCSVLTFHSLWRDKCCGTWDGGGSNRRGGGPEVRECMLLSGWTSEEQRLSIDSGPSWKKTHIRVPCAPVSDHPFGKVDSGAQQPLMRRRRMRRAQPRIYAGHRKVTNAR